MRYLTTPDAAESPLVNNDVEYWLEHRDLGWPSLVSCQEWHQEFASPATLILVGLWPKDGC